jgi:alpha-glutamyl/putrescinyl thymine pyrophosphorylase clade 1
LSLCKATDDKFSGMICEIIGGLMSTQQLIFRNLFPEDDKVESGDFTIAERQWRTSRVFETYWRFAVERQKIFFARLNGIEKRTDDPILQRFKFTNVYRASDRVSQYLIRHVVYGGPQTCEALFYRIMLFKLFNKIETWEFLQSALGELTSEKPRFNQISTLLNQALAQGVRIYSAAYIMPSGGGRYPRKHDAHLSLLEKMIIEGVPRRLEKLSTMSEAFQLLKSFPMLGDFLAYQFVTDLNYSTICDFSETEFVVAGPGARDGVRKCFPDLPMELANEAIKAVCAAQRQEFGRRKLAFPTLWGRQLQLIDCQNLFCEVDKYARVAHPDIPGLSTRTRIKQSFRPSGEIPEPYYPPKWNLKLNTTPQDAWL